MKYFLITEAETGEKYRCVMCGEILEEGYGLQADTDEEYDILEEKFGDPGNWIVGECCFGGYCGAVPGFTPTLFFEERIKPFIPIEVDMSSSSTQR